MIVVIANRLNNNDPTLQEDRILSNRVFTVGIINFKTGRYGWSTFSVPSNRYPTYVIKERNIEFFQGRIKPKTLLMKHVNRENRRTTLIYDCSILNIYGQCTTKIWYSPPDWEFGLAPRLTVNCIKWKMMMIDHDYVNNHIYEINYLDDAMVAAILKVDFKIRCLINVSGCNNVNDIFDIFNFKLTSLLKNM